MVLSPSVRDLKTHFNPMIFSFLLGLFGFISIQRLLFYPPPMPCSFLFSDTPPPPFPFALRAACQGEHPFPSALLSPALLPESVSFPLAPCLSSMSFLAWLCLSLKSTLLFLFFFYSDTDIKSHHSLHPNILILTLSSRIRPLM